MKRPIPEGVKPPEGCLILGWGDTFKVPENGFHGWRFRPGNKEWLECWKWYGDGTSHIYAADAGSEVARLNYPEIPDSSEDPRDGAIRALIDRLEKDNALFKAIIELSKGLDGPLALMIRDAAMGGSKKIEAALTKDLTESQ